MLPPEVLQQAEKELPNWHNKGISVSEISHRSKDFEALAKQSTQDLRDLLAIPENYHILFLQGGSRTQFSAVPMNLVDGYDSAAYVQTGYWGKAAATEAMRYTDVKIVADTDPVFNTIPDQKKWKDFSNAAYLHYVDNETIHGVEFDFIPDSKNVALVCDMSSNILSRPFDVSQFGLIYACAQKNISMAGITVVIVRDDLLSRDTHDTLPSIMNYALQAQHNSMYNTPPTFAWYVAGLVFQWLKNQGGIKAIAKKNAEKAALLYRYLDSQDFYQNTVDPRYRSRMNVIFRCPKEEWDTEFWQMAAEQGMIGLKGHKVLGGLRASIYNAMPIEGVEKLIAFMKAFAK